MSTHRPNLVAQLPKRRRGHLRVAAIMDAAVEVFRERGFDKATMTEIANRSSTATGSLYRFFPSKGALAEALLQRYARQVLEGLDEVEQQLQGMSWDNLADALVDFMLELQAQRQFALTLVDSSNENDEQRATFREALRQRIGQMLKTMAPHLSQEKCHSMSIIILHILKGIGTIESEELQLRRILQAEIRGVLRLYLQGST